MFPKFKCWSALLLSFPLACLMSFATPTFDMVDQCTAYRVLITGTFDYLVGCHLPEGVSCPGSEICQADWFDVVDEDEAKLHCGCAGAEEDPDPQKCYAVVQMDWDPNHNWVYFDHWCNGLCPDNEDWCFDILDPDDFGPMCECK